MLQVAREYRRVLMDVVLKVFRPVVFLKGKKPAVANLPWAKAQWSLKHLSHGLRKQSPPLYKQASSCFSIFHWNFHLGFGDGQQWIATDTTIQTVQAHTNPEGPRASSLLRKIFKRWNAPGLSLLGQNPNSLVVSRLLPCPPPHRALRGRIRPRLVLWLSLYLLRLWWPHSPHLGRTHPLRLP